MLGGLHLQNELSQKVDNESRGKCCIMQGFLTFMSMGINNKRADQSLAIP